MNDKLNQRAVDRHSVSRLVSFALAALIPSQIASRVIAASSLLPRAFSNLRERGLRFVFLYPSVIGLTRGLTVYVTV